MKKIEELTPEEIEFRVKLGLDEEEFKSLFDVFKERVKLEYKDFKPVEGVKYDPICAGINCMERLRESLYFFVPHKGEGIHEEFLEVLADHTYIAFSVLKGEYRVEDRQEKELEFKEWSEIRGHLLELAEKFPFLFSQV